MTRRWVCPVCGKGALAPSRPRKDDVRRYCLPCSTKTGRLVLRVAPAVEKARAESKERRAAKAATVRQTAKQKAEAQRTIGGFDLLAEARRLWRTEAFRREPGWRKDLPEITLRRTTTGKFRTSGFCWSRTRAVTLTVGTDTAEALEALAHELTHAIVRYEGHSTRFWSLLRAVAKEAWPTAEFDFPNAASRGYYLDQHIAAGIRGTLHK